MKFWLYENKFWKRKTIVSVLIRFNDNNYNNYNENDNEK